MDADVSDDKSSRWNCGHYTGQHKTHLFRRGDGRRAHRGAGGIRGDASVRVVVVTGGAPGYFIRHYSIAALIRLAESLRASGREWPENATYNGGFLDKAIALCESMPKPVIAAISGTALAGGFEFALSCDLRIAEDGDYLIGFWSRTLDSFPALAARKGCHAPSETPAALMHILMGDPLTPREAERKGLVHEP